MLDASKKVYVLVTTEALEDIQSPPQASIARFEQNRLDIEHMASDNYDAGKLQDDGSVWVRSADVVKFI